MDTMIAMWCIFDRFIFLVLLFWVCFIFVINYMSSFKIYRVCFSSGRVCVSHTALFQSFTRILVYHKSANISALYTYFLLHCNTLCKIPWLIYIVALKNCCVICYKLKWNCCRHRHKYLWSIRKAYYYICNSFFYLHL